jgi:hypothetical protein
MFPAVHGVAASSGGAALPWYLAGGAPMPVAVYEPAAAASLAASYIPTIATAGHPSLDPAVVGGIAPTFSGGWVGNGNSYLKTGITPSLDYAILVRFSDYAANLRQTLCGIVSVPYFLLRREASTHMLYGLDSNTSLMPPVIEAGVLGLAGRQPYRNGQPDGAAISGTNHPTIEMYILAANSNGSPLNRAYGKIEYIAIWDTSTGHATWMPVVSAAVALL